MKKPHSQEYHVSHEEIASFIEETLGEIDRARIQVHLQSCEDCLEAYRYAVRYIGMHDEQPAEEAPSAKAMRTAKAIAERQYQRENPDPHGKWRWLTELGPGPRVAIGVAVVAIFIAVAAWLNPTIFGGGLDPYSDDLAPITRALTTASQRNALVLPGVEENLPPEHPVLRSGPATITRELDNALSKLAIAYNAGSLTSDKAQWLISGYLATGQIANARVYIADARNRYPDDLDLRVLEGMLAYTDGDLDRAVELFEAVLGQDTENITAVFNLAVVEGERGNGARARDLLERVRHIAPGSPMAIRAEAIIAESN